jgi:flagellar biogenesis protein FliO
MCRGIDFNDRACYGRIFCAVLAASMLLCATRLDAQEFRTPRPSASSQTHVAEQVGRIANEPARFAGVDVEKQLPLPPPRHESTAVEKSASSSRTLGAIVSVVVSLAVVLGLFLAVAWLMRRGMPNSARRLPGEVVEVLGRTPLAGRQQMHVLRFGNKLLLVAASATGVDTIGEITDPLEIDRLAGLCAAQEATSASTTFKQIFGQLGREKSVEASASLAAIPSKTRRNSNLDGEINRV